MLMVNQDMLVNPTTFETFNKLGYEGVHAIGEVWAEILWVVSQKLIKNTDTQMTCILPLLSKTGLFHMAISTIPIWQDLLFPSTGTL